MNAPKLLLTLCLATLLVGCDQLGIETPDKVAARQEAQGKAGGGACPPPHRPPAGWFAINRRPSGRALEDCFEMNRRASKAAVYAGWRDMDGYMRENNIAVVKPAEESEASHPSSAAKADEGAHKAVDASSLKPSATQAVDTSRAGKAAVRTS